MKTSAAPPTAALAARLPAQTVSPAHVLDDWLLWLKTLPAVFMLLFFGLALMAPTTSAALTFDFTGADSTGDQTSTKTSASQTVSGITLTATSTTTGAYILGGGNFAGTTGNILTKNGGGGTTNAEALVISFSQAVDITSLRLAAWSMPGNSTWTATFTPTGGSNSVVSQSGLDVNAGYTISLNWTGVTSFTVARTDNTGDGTGGATGNDFDPAIDTIVFVASAVNAAPTASVNAITGTVQVGQTLTGSYTYSDNESNAEDTSGSGTSYRWVRADNTGMTTNPSNVATGTTGGANKTYTVQAGDASKYLFYCVTPKAGAGTATGSEACSAATSQVPAVVNGACDATNHGQTLTSAPASNLCTTGSASGVTSNNTTYDWTCAGSGGGTTPSCQATRNYVVTPSAGANGSISPSTAQNVAYNAQPQFTVTGSGGYVASVGGTCGGSLVGGTYTTSVVTANCTVSATFSNVAPSAGTPSISGTTTVGQTLTGSYTYSDTESNPEDTSGSGTSYRWVNSTDNSVGTAGDNSNVGTGTTGGSNKTYTLQVSDADKYLFYCVTPKATTGNITGTEACSSATAAIGATTPGAPTAVTPTAGSGQASVAFTAPVSNGGASIDNYSVTCTSSDGGASGTNTGGSSPVVVTGLTNGNTYTCTAKAHNNAGWGGDSSTSSSFTPKAAQTITFNDPGAQNFGTSPTLSASSTSTLTVAFTSATTGVCTVSGTTLTTVAAGTCTINADQAGNGSYNAATQVQRSFTVNAVVPGAPTIGTATAGNTQASVAFSAPASTGGAAITGYTVTANPGGLTGTGASSPITVTGLTNGTAYTFTVTATNSAGTGGASAASNSITPKAAQTITFADPGAKSFGTTPTLTATSDSSLTVTFSSSTTGVCTITSGGALTFVTTGTCTIDADQAGDGTFLAATTVSRSFTVNAVVPGAPTIGTASAGDTQATVTFTAPAGNGGAAITGYTVTSNPGGITGTGASSPITVTGLTNGVAYTFTVTATNSAGTGSASAASNSVTPNPGPAVVSVAVPANGSYKAGANLDFTITWDGNVTVTGTPRLALVIGVTTVQADYLDTPTATTTRFRYTVLAGQNDSDGIAIGTLAQNGGSTIRNGVGTDATLTLNSVASTAAVLVDTTAPTLPVASIAVNNQADPHKVVLTFSEALAPASLGTAADWTVTNNAGSVTYSVASVALSGGNTIVTVTLNAVDLTGSATYIPNSAANGHLKVTPPATLTDVAGNTYAAGLVTEAGATHTLDATAPTLSAVSTSGATSSGGTLAATASEKAKGYWIAVATGATAPTAAEVKAAVTYGGVTIVASGNGVLPNGTAGSITLSGLAASTGYDIHVMAEDAAGNPTAAISSTTITTIAAPAPAPASGGGTSTPTTTVLPTGGGTAILSNGQSVTVTENGKDGTSISLPPPITTPPAGTTPTPGAPTSNSVNVTLPGTGTIGVSSNAVGTQLGVSKVTLPGATTSVNTVTVSQGSASFTASEKGQAVAGLKNGIVVVSGSKDSQVTVDATGPNTTIGVKSADTIVVPTDTTGVAGTKVDLPPPTASGGQAATVNLNIGGQELTVQSSQVNTTMTFDVVNIGGVQTPVLAVTGNAQVSSSGEDKPIVSIAGNVIKTGKSSGGGSHQVCNTIVQASSDASSDVVHVVTCYIVLEPGTFSALNGGVGNSFAAIKDGIVWAGETAEFDKNGKVTSAYLGTREGTTSAVGDDIVPGGNKFAANGFTNNAFIPRLTGNPLRLSEAKLDESLFSVFNTALNATTLPATPSQSAQGILNFQVNGGADSLQKAQSALTFDLVGDLVSIFPSKRIRVDTARADGISVSNEGNVEVATGGLVTTFVPTVADPQSFAADIATLFPGAVSEMRWNGSWKVTTSDGRMFVGRPQWGIQSSASGNTFTALADGTVTYSANGRTQVLFPDFHDYTTLLATFSKELNDPNLKVAPRMNGSVQATVNGRTYLLYPQWTLLNTDQASGKPSWWLDNGVVYIKNADGTAQGFGVK